MFNTHLYYLKPYHLQLTIGALMVLVELLQRKPLASIQYIEKEGLQSPMKVTKISCNKFGDLSRAFCFHSINRMPVRSTV